MPKVKKGSPSIISSLKRLKDKININKTKEILLNKPLTAFFLSLGILLLLIVASNLISKPKIENSKPEVQAKEVQTYKIGSVPTLNFQGQIEKSGVVKILAQAGGIVQSINVKEGQVVGKGANLINLASNYDGGNSAGIQASLAQKQYETVSQTFDIQKDVINKQRDLTNKVRDNADKLRDISSQSLTDTQNLVDLNQTILDSIDQNIQKYKDANLPDTVLQFQQLKSQFLSAQNQIKAGLRSLQYTSDPNNNPQQMADLQKDITLKSLDMQEKSLQLSKDVAKLQLSLAYINTTFYHPTAPFKGTVDRIYVRQSQQINPGTPLLQISGDKQVLNAVVKVPENIAQKISKQDPSTLNLNNESLNLLPSYISKDATDGTLYTVIFNIPAEKSKNLTDGSYINIQIPVGQPDTGAGIPFLPIDSIFQTQEEAIVYIAENGAAKAKIITLGTVTGRYVEVLSGLNDGDQVILNRNVLEGDKVKVM